MCERMHVAGRLHALLQRGMQRLALALGEVIVAIKASLSLLRLLSHGGWLAAPRLRAAAPAVATGVRAGPTKGAGPCEMCQGQRGEHHSRKQHYGVPPPPPPGGSKWGEIAKL